MSLPVEITVSNSAADSLRRGHPWLWRTGISRAPKGADAGAEARMVATDGTFVARGLYDPDSPIAARVWSLVDRPIDAKLFAERITSALKIRARLFEDGETTAYRVLHGEGDRTPGFVIDRYGPVTVLRVDGDAAMARLEDFVAGVTAALVETRVETLVLRTGEKGRTPELRVFFGEKPPDTIDVTEHGVPFVVDLASGQKTGAFLDQRENRRRVGALARGRTVLNLFSYAGGFSLHAARGGATHVTSVDIAAKAHATAQRSFRLAGIDPSAHTFASADAFAFLEQAKTRGKKWDLVVSDPPSFAPSEKARPRAIAAYKSLHRACADVLAEGGVFCAASCSSHIDAEAFSSTLDDATLGTSALRLLELYGPPSDHPTVPAWSEGRYLKFAVLG